MNIFFRLGWWAFVLAGMALTVYAFWLMSGG
jgi:hypothetical protein